jgi:hypothetical protein
VVIADHPVAAAIRADVTAREALAELGADGMLIAAGTAPLRGNPALTLTYNLPGYSSAVQIGVHRPGVLSDVVQLLHRLRQQGLWGIEADIFIADLASLDLDPRTERSLREAIESYRRGVFLAAASLLGAAVEGAWSAAAERLRPTVPAVDQLADGDRTAQLQGAVAAAAIPADDLHAGVGVQPGAEGFRGPFGEHVDRPAGLDVHQHGPVHVPLAQGKIVDAQHQRRPAVRVGRGADQPQQRRPAGRAGQPAGQPGAGPAAQGQRDRLQHCLQAASPPAIASGQARYLLGERGLGTRFVAAEEPPGPQVNKHFLAAGRGIGQLPLITAVHPPRRHAASGAGRLPGTGPGQYVHRPARGDDTLDGQVGQLGNQGGESLKIARRA